MTRRFTTLAAAALAVALATAACGDAGTSSEDPSSTPDAGIAGTGGHDFTEIAFDAARLIRDEGVTANSARPAGIAALDGKLFVALGNLTVDCMKPAGPGYLAVIDLEVPPAEGEAAYRLIELPADCRNPQNVLAWGAGTDEARVFVSCSGEYGWGATPSEALLAIDSKREEILFTTTFGCEGVAEGCVPVTPGKMVMADGVLLVGDASSGRLFAVDPGTGATLPAHPNGVHLCDLHPQTFWNMTGDLLVTAAGVFATCVATSELVHLDGTLNVLSSQVIGSGAQLLARHGDELLVGDTLDNALYGLDLAETPPARVPGSDRLGAAANQILVVDDRAYVITSTDNTVQVIDLESPRAGDHSTARTIDQIPTPSSASPLATNTNPYAGAIAGGSLYVTLLGACTVDGDVAGNRLIRLDLGGND